jgi:ActR/RegA family two-component response regulator
MSVELEFLTAADKPALLGLSTAELQETAKTALDQLGFKVHTAVNHGEFLHKFAQVPYQIVILEELFSANSPEENESLAVIQRMPMNQRRHAVFVLFGFNLATFNPMQAYQQGVHAVVNPSEMFLLIQLIQKAIADNDMFLHTFREVQRRLA